jgi:Protein of unknown function (DUF2934)
MKSKAVAASVEDTKHKMTESEQTQHELVDGPSLEEIRNRAYEIYIERGCIQGWDQDDWFQAERELLEEYLAR